MRLAKGGIGRRLTIDKYPYCRYDTFTGQTYATVTSERPANVLSDSNRWRTDMATPENKDRSHRDRTYSITELCREFEVTPRTLRFYEQKGLLHPARRGWTRLFSYRDRA